MREFPAHLALLTLGLCSAVLAQDQVPLPGHTRAVMVPYIAIAPVIDGNLDDASWNDAATAKDFWISEEKRLPAEQTEVLIMSDGENLYFGFRCYDSEPESIQATKTRRDAGLGHDDRVSVELDSLRNYRAISSYSVTANGTQDDAIAGGRARKIEWKGDWKGAAVRTGYGWSAEIAIPYKILNYQAESLSFGVNFVRYHNRTDEWSRWADVTPQNKIEEIGQLVGLLLPAKAKQQPWTVMPYVLGGTNIPDIKGEPKDQLVSAGATIRYEPRANLTGVFSIYPDFTQLETQVTDIDFSYTEKFRADPRPFFQEGSFYLGSDTSYFYSNRIPDFYGGGKLFAQPGQMQTGGFVTGAPDKRWDGAFRFVKEMDALHSAGFMLVGTTREELDNQLLVAQLEGRERYGLFYSADAAFSNTEKQAFNKGGAYKGNLGWQKDYWTIATSFDHFDKEYFPANGLLKNDRFGTKSIDVSTGYYRESPGGPFRTVSGNMILAGRNTLDGRTQNHSLWMDGGFELRQQVRLLLSYFRGKYRPVSGERGEFSDTVNDDHYWAANLDFNTRSSYFGYGLYYADGFQGGDDYNYVTGYVWVNPTDNTFINISSERLQNFGDTRQTTVKTGWDITPENGLVARYIDAEEGDYRRLAYRRTVRSGMDVFAVYNREPFTEGQFSVKVVWVLR
jgi:hypothetical protein